MTMKSYEEYLLGLYEAMLSSIARLRPGLRVDCERDYKRLLSSVEKGGIRVFLEHLPAMGKHLDICLSQKRLTASNVAFMAPFRRRGVIPRLFKGLFLSVFDESGVLRIEPDISAIRFLRTLLSVAKKFRMSCSDSSTWSTVDGFYKIDQGVRHPTLSWDDDGFEASMAAHLSLGDVDQLAFPLLHHNVDAGEPCSIVVPDSISAIQSVADIVSAQLGRFDPLEWKSRHGPGVVSDLKQGMNKYSFPFWPDKLERVFPFADMAFHSYDEWAAYVCSKSEAELQSMKHEPPSRLAAVPKVLSKPRLIASEPVAHQWCQQTVADFLMSSVQNTAISSAISFRDQSKNGELALKASSSGSHATIDLSDASDRISCWVIERVLRRNSTLLDAVQSCRTRWIRNEIDRKSPRLYKLRKFTTMGSTVTFPMQTILFACIAIGATLVQRGQIPTIRNVRRTALEVQIFGDDIIVPSDSAAETLAALAYLGLKVNPSKTFLTGKFRESCGVDAYDGNDVTKISVLAMPVVSKPESVLSIVDTHNNFYTRGFYEVSEYLKRTVTALKRFNFFDVPVGSGSVGWFSLAGSDSNGAPHRFNRELQRLEYRVTRLRSPMIRTLTDGRSMLLQYFTEVHRPPTSKEERIGTASRSKIKLGLGWEPLPLNKLYPASRRCRAT
ncbi:RNA-directed RNA polymerase [ssRNA phage Esthiorhiza.2_47]|uniref:RNA-directed RNA polymerase n=2 Tax=Leviviricetes TaxID=2842243 RepID=A0A8S5L288_9VIRU|nr:RNA-directed RNA polymerase [ssRNA phage Esthiorhiza.2_47]QDH87849.1 MAG: RNA-dependent RNA polymerase [Leviviridae sp.]DAD51548.1 TPA_asm: RNA-directed RNA polymerase [ssRNA phage Esthiorhiza.2_47]